VLDRLQSISNSSFNIRRRPHETPRPRPALARHPLKAVGWTFLRFMAWYPSEFLSSVGETDIGPRLLNAIQGDSFLRGKIAASRAGLETVPVLGDRTLPTPYPPDKMICPAAQRPPGSSSQRTPSWREMDSNFRFRARRSSLSGDRGFESGFLQPVSQQRTVPAAGQRAPFGTVSIKRPCAVVAPSSCRHAPACREPGRPRRSTRDRGLR
jgi:hypothetical protein